MCRRVNKVFSTDISVYRNDQLGALAEKQKQIATFVVLLVRH